MFPTATTPLACMRAHPLFSRVYHWVIDTYVMLAHLSLALLTLQWSHAHPHSLASATVKLQPTCPQLARLLRLENTAGVSNMPSAAAAMMRPSSPRRPVSLNGQLRASPPPSMTARTPRRSWSFSDARLLQEVMG